MFPQWDSDVEDPAAENIIKVMFNQRPWKWTTDCWEVTCTWVNTKPAIVSPVKKEIVVVNEDSPRPRKKSRKEATVVPPTEAPAEAHEEVSEEVPTEARSEVTTTVGGMTKEDIERSFKDIADALREEFGTCLKEIKHLSDKLWIRRKSLPEDKAPDVSADASSSKELSLVIADFPEDKAPEPSIVLLDKKLPIVSDLRQKEARYQQKRDAALAVCHGKSDRTRKLTASHQSPYTVNSTAKVIIPNKKLFPGYNHFAH
ncbi:hypothetical protein Bca4012_063649 [Brassica carinata]